MLTVCARQHSVIHRLTNKHHSWVPTADSNFDLHPSWFLFYLKKKKTFIKGFIHRECSKQKTHDFKDVL